MNRRARTPLACGVLFVAAATAAPALSQEAPPQDWAGFRGPNLDLTVSDPAGIESGGSYRLEVVWRKHLGDGYSAISISEGIAVSAFADAENNYVGAFEAESGEPIWRVRMGPVFPGRYGSTSGPIATPLIAARRVFALDNLGILFALDLDTGEELWRSHFVEDLGAEIPFYGYSSSPLLYADSVIVQTGAAAGALTRFDASTGSVMWSAGTAATTHQAASLVEVQGQTQVVLVGDENLVGIEPETGTVLWAAPHGGEGIFKGSATTHLVPINADSVLAKTDSHSTLFRVLPDAPDAPLQELWQTTDLRSSYVVSVHHDGVFFGYNNRILNAVDAGTGERLWRSRNPGDGFPIVLNGHLVIATKDGKLSMGAASRAGYEEVASANVFDGLVWAPPSYVNGRLYLRSYNEWARVDIVPAESPTRIADAVEGVLLGSGFEQRATAIRAASVEQRPALVDAWMLEQVGFPIIAGDSSVHFVYRGQADEVALLGDLFGGRTDRQMQHIEGTDFFYFSSELESDARISYAFARDFGADEVDPLNDRKPRMQEGMSELAMPDWVAPAHLEPAAADRRGTVENHTMDSAIREVSIDLPVYLPRGFSRERAYPVIYMLNVDPELIADDLRHSLDNLMGQTVEPAVVVFVPFFGSFPYAEYAGDQVDTFLDVLTTEIAPFVEAAYPIRTEPRHRALVAAGGATFASVKAAFTRPHTFGKIGLQSMRWEPGYRARNQEMLLQSPVQDLTVYLDWGKYDGKSEREGHDARAASRAFAEDLRAAGYDFTGGEVHDGSGYDSWLQRTDRMLEALFPVSPEQR